VILHGSDYKNWMKRSSRFVQNYTAYILKITQGIVVLGFNLKGLFKGIYSENKLFVVPNGGNYNYPGKETSIKLKLLYLSNLSYSKGFYDVLESLLYLKEYHSKIIFDVVGAWMDENIKDNCNKFVRENNLPVVFHGSVTGDNKFQFLSNADIFVFPPKAPEGHPYAIVEAMAAGLPIISTDQGAIVESVKDGINGFIVEPGNPQQIADKISFLISHPDIRIAMGQKSRSLYEANFTEEKMIERLSNVFNEILK
jgi:glycosyltransferase involved in cell wall biosynthesis